LALSSTPCGYWNTFFSSPYNKSFLASGTCLQSGHVGSIHVLATTPTALQNFALTTKGSKGSPATPTSLTMYIVSCILFFARIPRFLLLDCVSSGVFSCSGRVSMASSVGINPSPLTRSWRRSVRVFKPGGVCARQGVVCVRRARGLCAWALCVCPVRVCALRVRASCTDGCARASPWRACDRG